MSFCRSCGLHSTQHASCPHVACPHFAHHPRSFPLPGSIFQWHPQCGHCRVSPQIVMPSAVTISTKPCGFNDENFTAYSRNIIVALRTAADPASVIIVQTPVAAPAAGMISRPSCATQRNVAR